MRLYLPSAGAGLLVKNTNKGIKGINKGINKTVHWNIHILPDTCTMQPSPDFCLCWASCLRSTKKEILTGLTLLKYPVEDVIHVKRNSGQ
jgi:hypothetical protein